MTLKTSEKALEDLGLEFNDDVLPRIVRIVDNSPVGQNLTSSDRELIKPIILAKAGDLAISKGRNQVTTRDVNRVMKICTFLQACLRSTILSNLDVSAVTLSASDVATLNSAGIRTRRMIAEAPVSELVEKSVKHTERLTNSKVRDSSKRLFERRLRLWRYQAKLLASRR